MSESETIDEREIKRESERYQLLELDTRGRVTIPASIRTRHGVDLGDDNEYWVEIEIKSIEVRSPNGDDSD